jgi:hypothetical protein
MRLYELLVMSVVGVLLHSSVGSVQPSRPIVCLRAEAQGTSRRCLLLRPTSSSWVCRLLLLLLLPLTLLLLTLLTLLTLLPPLPPLPLGPAGAAVEAGGACIT